jgi:competence protein ComEC
MSDTSLGHRAPLCWVLLPLVVGLIAAKLSPVALSLSILLGIALVLILASLKLSTHDSSAWAVALAAGVAVVGASYYELRRARLPGWDELPSREARLTVQLTRVFAATGQAERFSALGKVRQTDAHLYDLIGQTVALSIKLGPTDVRPIRGTTIELVGVLEPLPRRPGTDDFEAYLVDAGVNFRLSRGRLVEIAKPASAYATWREAVRERASARLGLGLEEHPQLTSALRGMLLGERAGLSEDQKALYLRSGAMHLFAISGLHIGVIAGGIIGLLLVFRAPRLLTFVIGSAALWFYVDLTGAVPSAVRAWLMVVCLHASFVLRAPGNPVAALAASALLVLLLDPMQLFGAGFQMSYAVVAALLLYGLPLSASWTNGAALWSQLPRVSQRWWHRLSAAMWRGLQGAVAISLAATIVGTISSIAFFGLFTPAGIVVNVVLIPLATGAILAGFLSLLTAVAGLGFAGLLFNHAAAVLLLGMKTVLETLATVPGTAAAAEFRAEWLGSATMAALLGVMMHGYIYRWERRRGGFWPPIALVAIILLGAVRYGTG